MLEKSEIAVLAELESLCTSPGYIHALAFLVFRDCYIRYAERMEIEDFLQRYSADKLIRSEFATLSGLMLRQEIDTKLPMPAVTQHYVSETDRLLLELHQTMIPSLEAAVSSAQPAERLREVLESGKFLREAVFYSGESAYDFQYRDLAVRKYSADDPWLEKTHGFNIRKAVMITSALAELQVGRLTQFQDTFPQLDPKEWTFLSAFVFKLDDIVQRTALPEPVVMRFLEAFAVTPGERNETFRALNDLNIVNLKPIIPLANGEYLFLQSHGLLEAVYESPFYWMYKDASYRNTAQDNRGRFLEAFSAERVEKVFGVARVHRNVLLLDAKAKRLGEIDVLVMFGDRMIILQAKTKRMTLEARRGNDGVIKSDFAKSVQDAYDQAFSCANLVLGRNCRLQDSAGAVVPIPKLSKVYLICTVSDHYPALTYQSSYFLNKHSTTLPISAPYVADVFAVDALAEMLETPLQFLSYLDRRTTYDDKFSAGHELTILSYHLASNLWLSGEYNHVTLGDDICVHLDLAMTVRRDGIAGERTPRGILTYSSGSPYRKLIAQIEQTPRAEIIELGMMLLKMSSKSIDHINLGITRMLQMTRNDSGLHDFTLGAGDTGITVHSSYLPHDEAKARLASHVELRKYRMKAAEWFGVGL